MPFVEKITNLIITACESTVLIQNNTRLKRRHALFIKKNPLLKLYVNKIIENKKKNTKHCVNCNFFYKIQRICLKTLDTISNCQKPVFSLGVSHHMHKITTCENFSSIGRRSCEITMKKIITFSHEVVCFQMLYFETSSSKSEVSKSHSWKITFFSRKLRHFRGSCFSQCFILSPSPHYSLPLC